jgi:peptidoglycan-associated lipoprotein
MKMQPHQRRLALVATILGLTVLATTSCHKKAVPPPVTPPTPAPSSAPTGSLTAEPSTIQAGQSATLTWSSENATDLDLEPGVGKVQAQGSTSVSPQESTTYTLTLKGPGGENTYEARVTVASAAPSAAPEATPPVTEEQLFEQSVKDAFFDYNKANIRPDAQAALNQDAQFFKAHPSIDFTIEGHCDERGTEEYNLGLGQRRADAAKNYLVNLGVDASRITTISYGKDRPFCTEHNETCWQENRRAHFVFGAESQ